MNKLVIIGLFGLTAFANQPLKAWQDYSDVAVIVNVNSPASLAIGKYFKSVRSIPDINMLYVDAPTAEEIDSTAFEGLRLQIESSMKNQGLDRSINYIVTTKGLPLKVNRGSTSSLSSPSSSVESELTCILGPYASSIGKPGRVTSPYYYQAAHFSRARYGVYLVTRLDGYTVQDVLNLIDRGGPDSPIDPTALFVLDQDPVWNSTTPFLNNYMATARTMLRQKGLNVLLNSDTIFVTGSKDVAGYMSWGSNDHHAAEFTQEAIPHNTYAPGAIAETYVSTSARSFTAPPSYGQSLIADLIQEGVSGAKGYVYEPFSGAMAVAFVLLDRYTSGYNLAESYFMASAYLSWMGVVVGDPKTSIASSQANDVLPVELDAFTVTMEKTPGLVHLRWETVSEKDNYGFIVQRRWKTAKSEDIAGAFLPGHGSTLARHAYDWTDTVSNAATYFYRIAQIDLDGSRHYSNEVAITIIETWNPPAPGDHCRLDQNYPNPFNPSTTIRYSLRQDGWVSVKVYDELGREVRTLVDEIQSAGTHTTSFAAGTSTSGSPATVTASGVYYCRLQAEGRVLTTRMICLK